MGGVEGGSTTRLRLIQLALAGPTNEYYIVKKKKQLTADIVGTVCNGEIKCQSFGFAIYPGARRPLQTSIVPYLLHDGSSTRNLQQSLQLKSLNGPGKPCRAADKTLTPRREVDADRWRLKEEKRRSLSPVHLAPGSHSV